MDRRRTRLYYDPQSPYVNIGPGAGGAPQRPGHRIAVDPQLTADDGGPLGPAGMLGGHRRTAKLVVGSGD
jgi:hypothetical protein